MIFVEASGLRPTAFDDPIPINPTPMAGPRAASPTVMLPFIFLFSLCWPARARVRAVDMRYSTMPCGSCSFTLAHQNRENGTQQHEDQRLHEAHQKFQEVNRHWQQPSEPTH